MRINRRTAIVGLGGAALSLGAWRSVAAPRRVHSSHHRVHWPLGRALRVAHLTDIHVGLSTPSRTLAEAAALTWAARPDLVVLTGDYVNHSLDHLDGLGHFVRSLPGPVVARLHAEIQKALALPEVRDRLINAGGEVLPGPVERLTALLVSERARYEKLIREARIQPD